MVDLFSNQNFGKQRVIKSNLIPDLTYIDNYISNVEHEKLINQIDQYPWSGELKRRVQHYGYKYDYKARSINSQMKVEDLPEWAKIIGRSLVKDGYFESLPDQLIVNEYYPGQGISNHIDCEPCFEETIVSVSLGSLTTMDFIDVKTKEKRSLLLMPRSAVVLKGSARYQWAHGIPARKSDLVNGKRVKRSRRISLTFRKVIIDGR